MIQTRLSVQHCHLTFRYAILFAVHRVEYQDTAVIEIAFQRLELSSRLELWF